MFIRRKPWFKRKNGQITTWEIDWGSDAIYIAKELSVEMRYLALIDSLYAFAKKRKLDSHKFFLDLESSMEFAELVNVIKRKRIR